MLPRTRPAPRPIIVALPKGRLLTETATLFSRAGFDLDAVFDGSRRLVYECGALRILVLRSSDIPTYVAYGAADIGVAGRDVIEEQSRDLYQPLDLGIGACRLVVAEPIARRVDERSQMHIRIATKYPTLTQRYLTRRGLTAEIIPLSGAIELGPLTGLADRIVDLVQTGETLKQNGLVEVDTIMEVTARLVVNPANLKLRSEAISNLISRLERQLLPRPRAQ